MVSATDDAKESRFLYVENEIDPYFSPHAKVNSKWIKDLNIKFDNMSLIMG